MMPVKNVIDPILEGLIKRQAAMNIELFIKNGRPLLEEKLYRLEAQMDDSNPDPILQLERDKVKAWIADIDKKWCRMCGQWKGGRYDER